MNAARKICTGTLVVLVLWLAGCSLRPKSFPTSTPATTPVTPDRADELQDATANNPDTVAWLIVPGTDIDGPVQQAGDNEYYMRRNERGEPSHEGCFFADYECSFSSADGLSPNTIIYGHSFTRLGQDPNIGFGQLSSFTDPDFTSHHSSLFLTLSDRTLTFEIISVGYANADTDQVCIKAYPTSREWSNICELTKARNQLDFPVDFKAGDRLLTLSTCTNDTDTRLLIVAVLKE